MGHQLSAQNEQIDELTASAASSEERIRRASRQADKILKDERHGPRKAPVSAGAHGAGGDGFVGGFLGVPRLNIMTSRSRVCGNKYKVNNQNLEKFDQILAKIPEAEKTKATLSTASLPEKREDVCRSPVQPPERLGPDISPSATMGSSVTAEYELFCKAFHSEAKQLLPDEEQEKVSVNPMRQLLQQASEAAARGLQLQRVTTAAGTPPSATPHGNRDAHSGHRGPIADKASRVRGVHGGQCDCHRLPAHTGRGTASRRSRQGVRPGRAKSAGGRPPGTGEPRKVRQRNRAASEAARHTAATAAVTHSARGPSSRRWSENPVNAPIFMAKKFAEKMRRTKEGATPPASEVAPSTSPALPGSSSNQAPPTPSMTQSRRKSSTSSQRRSHKNAATVPKTPPSPSSKQPSASGPTAVVQEQQQPQARSPSSVTSRESTHTSTSSKKRGKHKRKSRSSKEPEG
ncbi:hypothetical protein MTO96_035271 [Rhipicephalus appendiculatus]